MANLLERASVVLTPTAYNNGEALCIKPDDASGDFQFSRNSAATRVNAQGLVENVQILSSNLVQNGDFSEEGAEQITNGDFSNGSADWNNEGVWTIENGVANGNGANGASKELTQFITPLVIGKTYKIVYDVLNYVSGSVLFVLSGDTGTSGIARNSNGTYTEYVSPLGANSNFKIRGSVFNGSVTNISVKEVGMDWNFGNSWSLSDGVAYFDAGANGNINQNKTFVSGKKYRTSFEIKSGSGSIALYSSNGATNYAPFETYGVGTHIVEFDYTTGSGFGIFASKFLGGAFSIDNISLIEITHDTNLPRINYEGFSYQDALGSELVTNGDFNDASNWALSTGWSIADGKATYDGLNGTQQIISSGTSVFAEIGKAYKVSFDVLEQGSGANSTFFGGVLLSTDNLEVGSYVFYGTAISTGRFGIFGRDGSVFSIDNVSVKEYLGQEVVPNSGCGSWLFEPQSTNLVTYSEDFSNAYWIKATSGSGIAPIVTSNYAISPDGTQNADRIQFDATTSGSNSDRSRIRTTLTLSDVTDYTFSFYAKSTDGTDQQIGILFDNSQISVKTITSEWQRFEGTAQQFGTSSICGLDLRGGVASTSDILVYGVQVEQQSYATSYIPTSGSTVTRNQDVCTNGGSLATINSTEGVLYAEIAALVDTDIADRVISLSDNTITNRVELKLAATGSIQGRFDSATSDTTLTKIGISTTNTNKIALYWESGKCALWINGIKEQENLTFNTFASNALIDLSFNSAFSGGSSNFFGKTKAVAVFPYLTDSELTELTTI